MSAQPAAPEEVTLGGVVLRIIEDSAGAMAPHQVRDAVDAGEYDYEPRSVYTVIQRLRERGYVQRHVKETVSGPMPVYTVTDEGRAVMPEAP